MLDGKGGAFYRGRMEERASMTTRKSERSKAAALLGRSGGRKRWAAMSEDERKADRAKAAKTLRRRNREKARQKQAKEIP